MAVVDTMDIMESTMREDTSITAGTADAAGTDITICMKSRTIMRVASVGVINTTEWDSSGILYHVKKLSPGWKNT